MPADPELHVQSWGITASLWALNLCLNAAADVVLEPRNQTLRRRIWVTRWVVTALCVLRLKMVIRADLYRVSDGVENSFGFSEV